MHSLLKRKASLTATIGNYTNNILNYSLHKALSLYNPLMANRYCWSFLHTQSILLNLVPSCCERDHFQSCQIQLFLWVPGLLSLWLRESQRLSRRQRQGAHSQACCHCINNSQVTNECLILSHPFLGLFFARVGHMDGSFQEASIKLNQHIPRINIQNLGQHKVFLHYSHTSVDDSAFCSQKADSYSINDGDGGL